MPMWLVPKVNLPVRRHSLMWWQHHKLRSQYIASHLEPGSSRVLSPMPCTLQRPTTDPYMHTKIPTNFSYASSDTLQPIMKLYKRKIFLSDAEKQFSSSDVACGMQDIKICRLDVIKFLLHLRNFSYKLENWFENIF